MISVVILYISTHKSTCQTDSFFTSYKNLIYLNIQFIKYYIKYTFPYHCFFYKKILTNIIVCENKFTLINIYTMLTHVPLPQSFATNGKYTPLFAYSNDLFHKSLHSLFTLYLFQTQHDYLDC